MGSGFKSADRKGGFPHSEITGSKGARASPVLIAACHVLHRLSTPRHPSEALSRLIVLSKTHAWRQWPRMRFWFCLCQTMMSSRGPPWRSAFARGRADPSFTMSNPTGPKAGGNSVVPLDREEVRLRSTPQLEPRSPNHAGCRRPPFGGARRDRTDDLMLAKHALYRLSYGPPGPEPKPTRPIWVPDPHEPPELVGPGRLELPTLRLSGVRSNHLSYGPSGGGPLRGAGSGARWARDRAHSP